MMDWVGARFWALMGVLTLLTFQNCTPVDFSRSPESISELSSLSKAQFSTLEDTPATFSLKKLLPQASDFAFSATAEGKARAENGSLSEFNLTTGVFTYSPDADWNGLDHFEITYQQDGASQSMTVQVGVVPVNDAPVAPDQRLTAPFNQAFEFSIKQITAHDVDGDKLDLVLLDGPMGHEVDQLTGSWGSLKRRRMDENGNQVYQFLPQTLENTTFRFLVRDPSGAEARFALTFQTEEPLLLMKPALAVSDVTCLMCHASIKGNVVSNFGAINNEAFLQEERFGTKTWADWTVGNYNTWGSRSGIGSSFIQGTVFLPRLYLSDAVPTSGESVLKTTRAIVHEAKNSMRSLPDFGKIGEISNSVAIPDGAVLDSAASESFSTFAEYLNSIVNHRTQPYLGVLRVWDPYLRKSASVTPETTIREVRSVRISAPTPERIRSKLQAGKNFTFYRQGDAGDVKGLVWNATQKYFSNSQTEAFSCDGDLFLDAPLLLKNLKLNSTKGCRIYSTGTVFVQGPEGTVAHRAGIQFTGGPLSNLEVTSSSSILMGFGSCTKFPEGANAADYMSLEEGSLGRRLKEVRSHGEQLEQAHRDYQTIRDANGQLLLVDAGDCNDRVIGKDTRSVDFSRLLLNAPRVDSRYIGDFSGSVIAKFSIWSLGSFHYSYDPVFDSVPIFPLIPSEDFFSVQDCNAGGVDSSRILDTRFRTCN